MDLILINRQFASTSLEKSSWPSVERSGVVSIWVFLSPERPEDLGKDVLRDRCGVESYDLDMQGMMGTGILQSVLALIEPISYSSSFIDEAEKAAGELEIKQGLEVLAQFDFAYDSKKAIKPIAKDPACIGYFEYKKILKYLPLQGYSFRGIVEFFTAE